MTTSQAKETMGTIHLQFTNGTIIQYNPNKLYGLPENSIIPEIPQSVFIPTWTEELFGGVGDSLGDMRDGIVYAVNHPIQTAEHMVRMVSDPTYLLEVALATIQDYKNYIESNSGARVAGRVATDVVVGVLVTRGANLGLTTLKGATSSVPVPNVTVNNIINNPFPENGRFASVMPNRYAEQLAHGGKLSGGNQAWITAADDLSRINTVEGAAKKLTLIDDSGSLRLQGDVIVEFDLVNMTGIASPFNRPNAGFINGGRTGGGAREWLVPSNIQITNINIRYLER